MMTDLFSSFDYAWGGGAYFMGISVWFSSVLVPFFLMSFMTYWVSPNYFESVLMSFSKGFTMVLPPKVKTMSGSSHLFISLLLVFLFFNLSGVFPYSYPVSAHFIATMSFALPFWFMTFILNFNPNWRLFWLISIRQGGSLMPTAMAMISEWVSLIARPVTLMCRLSMNIIVGQLVLKLVSSVCVGLLYPFGMMSVSSLIGSLIWFSMTLFLFLFELCVGFLQAFIFVGLLVFYVYEVVMSPE
uniref:ATP synthase subunit a n=2 Tax=Dosinia TaxID=61344 RepID=A0A2U8JFA0_9BIVA|nr:ATP synthase F0 subunit 6 [Dosinia troscheli]YP_009498479.1 ATP synthase F0 subunit 6 [Dosinia japonica]AWI68006.1 ATP synthase F0 subunit 6 [Dosinia troscheli]AWK60551.1 ATP synthase F0 subunit 6 [Dosinia japonica]